MFETGESSRADGASDPDNTEYELKIDEQVIKFLELRHTLTFFIVTASVAPLGFTLTFALDKDGLIQGGELGLLATASIITLSAAAFALSSLFADISSFQKHLRYRYERQNWKDLGASEQNEWTQLNRCAASRRKRAFLCLILGVAFQSAFLILNLAIQTPELMHHYGEDSTEVREAGNEFILTFKNKVSGKSIVMHVPRRGAGEEPTRELTHAEAENLAHEIAHLLRRDPNLH